MQFGSLTAGSCWGSPTSTKRPPGASSCSASPGAGKRMSLKKMMLFSNYRPKKSQQKSMDRNTNICFKLFSKSINLSDKE